MENLSHERTNVKYKMLRQNASLQDDNHETPEVKNNELCCDKIICSETEGFTEFLSRESKITDEHLTDSEDFIISEEEVSSYSDTNICVLDESNRHTTVTCKEINKKKALVEIRNKYIEHVVLPKVTCETVTDIEDFDAASDEQLLPNKISTVSGLEKGNAINKVLPIERYSDSESSASTDIEIFGDESESMMKFDSLKPKVFRPMVIMSEKDDDLEDVFLSSTSKGPSSFQTFMSKQSHFIDGSSNDDDVTDTEPIEIDDNELPQLPITFEVTSQTDCTENVMSCIGLQGVESHYQQLKPVDDEHYHFESVTEVIDFTTSEDEEIKVSDVEELSMAENKTSFTKVKQSIKFSDKKKLMKNNKVHNSQRKINIDTLPVLKVISDSDTDIEDLSNNETVKVSCKESVHQQINKVKFNKKCHTKNNETTLYMKKSKLSSHHLRVSKDSSAKYNENEVLTDIEDFDTSEDGHKFTRNCNSNDCSSMVLNRNEECKNLLPAVTSKISESHHVTSTIDDIPLTDTEELVFSDIDVIAKNQSKEWTETDDSGGVRHVIQKKTIVTVSEPEEIMLMKGKAEPYLAGAANLPPGNSPDEKEEESLSFAEKRDFFQRLSMTAGEMPQSSSEETKVLKDANATDSSSSQPEEVIEEKVMRTEAIVEEQISFTERLRMFEEGKDDSKKAFPDKTKEDNEQKFELDKEELTESEIAALEYLEGKSSTLEECATDNLVVETQNTIKDVSLKETTSLDAVEQEVASMLAEVDRQSRELLGHAVGLLPEGEQPLTKLELAGDTDENEQEETGKHNLPNYQFPSKTDVSSTEFQYEMRGRDLVDIENEQENIKGRYDEMLTETKSSQQLSDEHAASVQFWPPQSPTTVKDENFMPEQQTAAGKTTTEDTVLPSPSKDSPSHKKAIGFDTSQSVQFSSGMEVDEPSMTSSHFVQSVPKRYPEQEEVLEMDINLSVKVQQQIKSQIFNEELDQSIEENPPEEKMLGISKLPDIEREKKMAQHIKTTILSQELEADIESGSPERKEFPSHSSSVESGFETLPTVGIVSPTQQLLSAIEQKAEQITWEAPIQEQLEDMAQEEIQEIPREKQFIVEHDEDEEQVFIEQASIIEEATTFKTENRETSASSPETSASDSLSTKDHKEKFVHPSLEQIPSEISDEDLVERDSSPSELETKCIFPAEETTPLHETAAEKDTFPSTVGDTNTKSKDYIEKAHEVELHHDFSSDDISKEYEISEAEKDDKQIAEYETHVDSYSSEGSDYTQRETEATLSSGAASEEPHYKHGYRQDSSETSDKESVHPLYVTAETLYTSRKKGKKYDSDPSNGAKEDYGEVVLRQKSASRKKDDSQIVGDIESWSSSGETESHYYSFEASDSSKTPQGTPVVSRPCSSEFEVTIVSGQPSSEYDTCVTSQEASIGVSESYATAATSQETSYSTACSSLSHSSRESAYSVDSESSGHLASLELSSEASETLVPSAQEIEMDLVQEIDTPILEEDTLPSYPAFKEPYDSEIPECIIRGGIEIPFLQDWSLQESQSKMSSAKEWLWPCEGEDQTAMSPFEIITTDDLAECLQESYENQFQKCSKKVIEQGESLHDLDKKVSTNGNNLTSEKSSVDKFASENENQDDRAESEKYLQFSETSEFESHVTTVEIETVNVPGDEDIAEPLSHDELSISESSATQSEQTWQTSSIETAIHISQQMPPCFMPYTETPPVTRVDSTYSDVTTDQSSSPSHTAIVHDSPSQPAEEEISSISMYHQLNGPVEVDYIPEYDAPFADNRENASDPPVQTLLDNQLQQISHDAEGQEWQPPKEFMDGSSETCMLTESLEQTDEQRLSSDACNQNDQVPIRDSYQDQQQLMQHEHSGTLSTDLWHVKHEQVDELQELNKQQEIGASVTAPRQQEVFSGEASCLPESDQDTLHSWEVVHPSSEDYQIEKPKLETRDSFDMTDKAEAIDTSPEDDRYDNLLHDMEEQPCYMNNKDDSSAIIEEIEYAPVYQQELEPAESIQQATLERNDCESQATYMYSMGFEKEHIILPEGSIEPSVDDNFQDERSGLQGSFTESEFSHISYERGQEYDDVSLGYGELYTHQEEDEETEDTARYDGERQCNAAAMSAEDDKRSTPSYDTLSIRKFFGKSGEHDDMSVSSLQEFERLEAEISMGSRLSQGSGDSNGRQSAAKSGEQDDVSMNSLTEFEKFEKECTDGEYKESAPIDDVSRLSEIEEGHESLSEASQATLSDHLAKRDDSENSDDYEKRMNEIDEIIKQAQSNVEKFDDDSSIAHSLQKSLAAKNLHTASSDKIESSLIDISPLPKKHQESLEEKDRLCISQETQLPALLEREQTEQELELSPASLARHIIIGRTISGHSVESGESLPRSSTSTVTQYDAESLKDRDTDIEEMDVASIQDKKISPTEDDKYFPQEIDQDFQNKWSTQQYIDRSESDTNQTKDFCYVQPEIDYTAPETEYFMPPAEFKMPCDISTGEAFDIQWTEEESYLSAENLTAEIESIKAETVGSGHSSSNGKDGSGRGDCMISSTDSIDPSSSTATHATYQFETDSVMSSSINSAQASGEEFTMISSTDTLEAEPKISHVREHTFEEIPEAPHAEQQMFMEDDRIDSASFGQCVTIQVGTEEYESLPYEVKEKLNEMLAEPTIENETVDESQESFCDSEIITVRKTTKYHSQSGAKKMLSHEHESQKFAEMQDVSGDQVFLSEDHLKEWRQNERAEYILGQTHMLSQFQYDGQTLRDSSYSMPDGTEALLYHPISPGVSPTAHQTHRSESDLDEPETFLTEAGETSAVSHGISPVTGRKDFGEAKDNGTIDDDEDECTVKTRIVTKTTIKTDGQEVSESSEDSEALRESMQQILDDFMSEESSRKKQDGK